MPDSVPETRTAWAVSLAFWLAMIVAAGLYGAVSLSQKVLTYHEQRRTYVANQYELVRMEKRNQYLKRVAHVMQTDPQFAAELARTELHTVDARDERIPVDHELTLEATGSTPVEPPALKSPVYEPLLREFARNDTLRNAMLAGASFIVLFAFVFLNESQIGHVTTAAAGAGRATGGARRRLASVFSRYRKR